MYYDTDLFDIPHSHETDDETGWFYQDLPYGGFLVYEYGEVQTHRDGREVAVPFAVTIEFTDLEGACGEPGFLVESHLTPIPDVLSDEKKASVSGSMGWSERDLTIYDVAAYGLRVPLESEWGAESWEAGFEELRDGLMFGGILPGFVMDRAWNRLGTTGWDLVHDALFDEDAFDAALDRLRRRYGMNETDGEVA